MYANESTAVLEAPAPESAEAAAEAPAPAKKAAKRPLRKVAAAPAAEKATRAPRKAARGSAPAATKAPRPGKAAGAAKTAPANRTDPEYQKTKPIRWTPIKTALLAAFLKLGATSADTARGKADLAKASNGRLTEGQVNHQLNPLFDLAQQGVFKRAALEEGLRFYLTAKGVKLAESQKSGGK